MIDTIGAINPMKNHATGLRFRDAASDAAPAASPNQTTQ
jgi:hypothetical protein